jgi:hypothetical protein
VQVLDDELPLRRSFIHGDVLRSAAPRPDRPRQARC